jgi:hypothetical protein
MKAILFTTTALAMALPVAAHAADATPVTAPDVASDIIVTGTRTTGTAADSAAPIQLLSSSSFQNVGQQDLTQILAQSLPSLNFQAFGGDTANLTLTAALRGLSPNDTLVLINGKRRHFTANLAVLGGSPTPVRLPPISASFPPRRSRASKFCRTGPPRSTVRMRSRASSTSSSRAAITAVASAPPEASTIRVTARPRRPRSTPASSWAIAASST